MPSGYIVVWTKDQDEAIRKAYAEEKFPIKFLLNFPLFRNCSKHGIKRRAYKLGFSTKRRINYTNEEKEQIIRLLETKTPDQIARIMTNKTGIKRTPMAIRGFISTRHLRIKPDFYNATDLIHGFRCSEKTLRKWVDKGWLKVHRDPGKGGDNTWYRITPLNVAKFITQYPYEMDTCRIDVPWFSSLLLEFAPKLSKSLKTKKENERSEEWT